ncbi:MAG TPA: hypothetical protein VJ783_20685, partial [Pirellulales bacterium]|nr:hypothetical protein [Pirellulales bacterium]
MPKRRPQMTSIDYVVIALSPLLIMLLVGSLCFFLLAIGYHGQFAPRMNWIMFWFVVAIVGIARISMEEGAERASLYGLGLCAAVGLAVAKFVDNPWIAWGLMALAWWCAHQLTWDCTLIDDEQDASGEGLLQIAGLDEGSEADDQVAPGLVPGRSGREPATRAGTTTEVPASRTEATSVPASGLTAVWRRLLGDPDERRRPHAPGLWVVYFSMAALPLFGLGQAFVPASDAARRRYVFWLLIGYVASAMGLLLTTSFLGLRRYLRQRKLEMPLTMTGTWLGAGAVLILVLILAAMLVPRPNAEYPVEQLIANALKSPTREASRHAVLRDSPA